MNQDEKIPILVSTISTLIITLLEIAYSLTWGILFVYYIEKKTYNSELCHDPIVWGRWLYFLLISASGLHLISSIIRIVSNILNEESNIPKYILTFKSCLSCIITVIMLIGITANYIKIRKIDSKGECKPLTKLMLYYIICEWSIIGFLGLCVYIICLVSITCLKKKKIFDDVGEVSDDECEI
jgi:hypothetical protein